MKYIVGIIVLIIIAVVMVYPLVNSERLCYEKAQQLTDSIQVDVISRGITKQSVCEKRMDVLDSLESCVQAATASGTIADFAGDLIPRLVSVVRPYSNNVFTQKAAHNSECADFSWTRLE